MQLSAMQGNPLTLMQDNAPSYASRFTRAEIAERRIKVVSWPPYSPNLNPIETCWNKIKDHIEALYGDKPIPLADLLRVWVKEAWDAIPKSYLREKILLMRDRIEAVITANRMHTLY